MLEGQRVLEDNEIILRYSEKGFLEKVEFVDNESRILCNTFDIVNHSPYSNLPFPEKTDCQSRFKCYDLTQVSRQKVFETVLPELPYTDKCGFAHAFTHANAEKTKGNMVLVRYTFNITHIESGEYVAYSNTLILLDREGNVVWEKINISNSVNSMAVTADGRFLASYESGEVVVETDCMVDSKRGQRVNVYDMSTGNIFYEHQPLPKTIIRGVGSISKYRIMVSLEVVGQKAMKDRLYKYVIVDPYERITYSTIITYSDLRLLKDVTDEAFIFRGNPGKVYYYEKEFEKTSF